MRAELHWRSRGHRITGLDKVMSEAVGAPCRNFDSPSAGEKRRHRARGLFGFDSSPHSTITESPIHPTREIVPLEACGGPENPTGLDNGMPVPISIS
jgi:hypothetical protein